jgi:transposase
MQHICRRASRQGVWISAASYARRAQAYDRAQAARPVIVELQRAGIVSLVALATELTRGQWRTPGGKTRWYAMTVKRVLDYEREESAPPPTNGDVPWRAAAVAASVRVRQQKADDFARTILPIIAEIRTGGITSTHGIAAELNRRGIPTREGKQWFGASVGYMLRRAEGALAGDAQRPCAEAMRAAADRRVRQIGPAVLELRSRGFSLAGIGIELERRGLRAARGGRWHRASVKRLLARCRSAGTMGASLAYATLRRVMAEYVRRRLRPFIERSMRQGCNTMGKVFVEAGRADFRTVSGHRYASVSSFGVCVRQHCPDLAELLQVRWLVPRGPWYEQLVADMQEMTAVGISTHAARAAWLNQRGRRSPSGYFYTRDSVVHYMGRLGLIPSRPDYEEAQERRRVHAKRKLDGYARHGTLGVRALTERAKADGLVPVSGRGEWTERSTSKHYQRLGRKAAGYALSKDQIMTIRSAKAAAFAGQLRATIERLMRRDFKTPYQLADVLNQRGVKPRRGTAWNRNRLSAYLTVHWPDLYQALVANRAEQGEECWAGIAEAFAATEGLSQPQRVAEFNRLGVPTFSGRIWTRGNLGQAARKLGFARSLEQRAADRAQAKATLDGMNRHRGIKREPPLTRQQAAEELTRRLGRVVTKGQVQRLSPRHGDRQSFWTAERRAEVLAASQAGKSPVEIAWEFSVSDNSIKALLQQYRDNPDGWLDRRRLVRGPAWTAERRAAVLALSEAGKTPVQIAKEYSVTAMAVRTLLWRCRKGGYDSLVAAGPRYG